MTRQIFPLIAMMLLLSFGASAQPGRGFREEGLRRLEKLDLSAEQKSALKDAMREHRKKGIDLRAAVQKKRLDLKELMDAEQPDRKRYEALNKEIADVQLQQKMLLFDMRQSLMNILTPEQRKTWLESRDEGMRGMRGRDGHRPGRHGDRDDDEDDD
ncbi:MAG: periplasmic heavy metal sensor [Bacteroidia bacterium]|nr:periplasmic heavy metal sensor [Bacteroidia bacterium]